MSRHKKLRKVAMWMWPSDEVDERVPPLSARVRKRKHADPKEAKTATTPVSPKKEKGEGELS